MLFLISLGLIAFITWYLHKYLTSWQYIESLPGPKTIPLLGNAHIIGRNPKDFLKIFFEWRQKYGTIFRFYIGLTPYVVISDPKDIEVILSSKTMIDKGDIYDLTRPWLGDSLLLATGEKWHKHRKMITPSFHFKILIDFLDIMNENAVKFVEKLREKSKNNQIIDFQELVHYVTLDVICETAMGIKLNSMDNPKSDIVTAYHDMCCTIQRASFSPIKRNPITFKFTKDYQIQQKALKVLKDVNLKIIEERRKIITDELNLKNSNQEQSNSEIGFKQKRVFLDNLLTANIDGRPLTNQEIYEEVSTFMFGGQDTTSSAIAFAVYILSRHQEIQEQIYQEQCAIFGNEIRGRSPTNQEIQEMKYMDLLLKESLRLYPSVPAIGRLCNEDIILSNKKIPKNTSISLFLMLMGYNEQYFKDPYKVDLKRFDERDKINPFENVPFSAGPRNCIGQKYAWLEMKSVISRIVRHFKILPPKDDMTDEVNRQKYDPQLFVAIVLKSENGIQIRLQERSDL